MTKVMKMLNKNVHNRPTKYYTAQYEHSWCYSSRLYTFLPIDITNKDKTLTTLKNIINKNHVYMIRLEHFSQDVYTNKAVKTILLKRG